MRFTIAMLLTMGLVGLGGLWLPWWQIALGAGLAGALLPTASAWGNFGAGALGVGCWWLLHAWWLHSANEGLLLPKISAVLTFSPLLVWILMFVIGALIGGAAGLTGRFAREAFVGIELEGGQRRRRRR